MLSTVLAFLAPYLTGAKKFYLKYKYNVIVTVLVIILLFIVKFQHGIIKSKDVEISIAKQNLIAANDVVRITKDKEGKDESNRYASMAQTIADLEQLNADLSKEAKQVKGKVNEITKTTVVIKHDTISVTAKVDETQDKIKANFNFYDSPSPGNYYSLEGYTDYNTVTKHAIAVINKSEVGIKLYTGIKNLEIGKPEIFVRSDYPGLTITGIEGAVINPSIFQAKKPKPPLLVISAGVGWTPVVYDWKTGKTDANITRIGFNVGIGFNLLRLIKQ